MKYLKSFNEKKNYQEIFNDIIKLCEESLVYLLDDPLYKLDYFSVQNTLSIEFLKKSPSSIVNQGFSWDDIKNDYIPLIEMLNSKYKIYEFERNGKKVSVSIDYFKESMERDGSELPKKVFRKKFKDYTLEEILNDMVDIENLIKVKVTLVF